MIKYGDLVQYIKDNHISWDKDLFDVLRGFFEKYSQLPTPPFPPKQALDTPKVEFKEPDDGEYSAQDLINLFSQ